MTTTLLPEEQNPSCERAQQKKFDSIVWVRLSTSRLMLGDEEADVTF